MGKGGQGKARQKEKEKRKDAHLVGRELPSIIRRGHVPFPKPLLIFLDGNSFIILSSGTRDIGAWPCKGLIEQPCHIFSSISILLLG